MNIYPTLRNLAGGILLCGIPASSFAAPLSPQQAMARVQSSGSIHKMPGSQSLVLAHTEKAGGESYLYVFNRGTAGFVIASADDRMPAVLGYSDNGGFDVAKASPELKWWLEQYAAQANSLLSSGSVTMTAVSSRTQRAAVPEMLTTRWSQDDPYDLLCPMGGEYHCVTGCVATAMAQIIKYHGYPATGTGSHSYTWQGQTLSYDFGAANFDYANMLDEYLYYQPATEEQNMAVAELMYACGVSVDMRYSMGASSAFSLDVPRAITEYFGYDKGVRFLLRDCYSAEEWDDIIYGELAAGRPVLYGGQSTDGGHEFVCDGYEDGYFHINWGWSGMGNGWFLLSALDPGLQGIGGFEGGYNYEQDAVIGIRPDAGNSQTTYPLIANGGLVAGSVFSNSYVEISISGNGVILNYSPDGITTSLCLKAVSETGEETVGDEVSLYFRGAYNGQLYGYSGLTMALPSVGQGSYTVYMMYTGPQGDLQPVQFPFSGANHLDMSVDADGNVSFSQAAPEQQPKIKVTQLEPVSEVLSGVATTFNISIENISEYTYSGTMYINAYIPGSEEVISEMGIGGLALAPGGTLNGTLGLTYYLPDGEYVLRCYDMYGEVCSQDFPLTIGHPTVDATGISLDMTEKTLTEGDSFTLTATVSPEDTTDKTVTWTSSDPAVATVDGGVVTAIAPGSATITASTANGLTATCAVIVEARIILATSITLDQTSIEAPIGTTVKLTATVLPDDTTDKTVAWSTSDATIATVDAEGNVTIMANGTATITASTTDGSGLSAECTVYGFTSIESIMKESGPVDIYTMGGLLIRKDAGVRDFETLARGIYIIRSASATYKIMK